MPSRRHPKQSPTALLAVIGLHVALLALMLNYQPKLGASQADVLLVSMITLPQPLPVEAPPEPPKPKPKLKPAVRKVKSITPPAPIEAPSQTAISLPPAPPSPVAEAEVIASAPPSPPAPPAPIVLPRFDADYLRNSAPAYPSLSRRMGEQGRVLVRVVVRPDGMPDSVVLRQSSGSQRLDEAALDAVRRWRFVPARQGSTPVTAAVIIPIVFSLEG